MTTTNRVLQTISRRWLFVGIAVAGMTTLPHIANDYVLYQAALVASFYVTVMGLTFLTGHSGQISLGHSAFFGVGAYTTAHLVQAYEVDYLLTIPLAAALCFAIGYAYGFPALRLQGLYLALVTVAFAVSAPPVFKHFSSITGGVQGLSIPQPSGPAFLPVSGPEWRFYVSTCLAMVIWVITSNLLRGRVGRGLRAIRDNEPVALAMGVSSSALKVRAFAYSASLAGISGSLFAGVVGYVSPDSFTLFLNNTFIVALAIGGTTSLAGALVGTVFVVFLPRYTSQIAPALSGVTFGAVLVTVIVLVPGGLPEVAQKLYEFARERILRLPPPTGSSRSHDGGVLHSNRDQRTELVSDRSVADN